MNHAISVYSVSGYQQRMGGWERVHIEHEHCPPFALVLLVMAVAMLGGVWFSDYCGSIAAGSIAWVAILAVLGSFVHLRYSGAAALERRIRRRQKSRQVMASRVTPCRVYAAMA
ncbi:hypothetical protein [Caballeronia insecticola]|uniref:Uncharacterized protein n=1 Tax=Caballeronia insecticola TaxID=758793 RepID=R4WM48_9BURK|nr:hypothetical protein [Caballeronia insecticola]BAN25683.1 hypothetical protein BRPE64_BCDS10220 [Caballeronia insecticola]